MDMHESTTEASANQMLRDVRSRWIGKWLYFKNTT
jgi:hypothetical protein